MARGLHPSATPSQRRWTGPYEESRSSLYQNETPAKTEGRDSHKINHLGTPWETTAVNPPASTVSDLAARIAALQTTFQTLLQRPQAPAPTAPVPPAWKPAVPDYRREPPPPLYKLQPLHSGSTPYPAIIQRGKNPMYPRQFGRMCGPPANGMGLKSAGGVAFAIFTYTCAPQSATSKAKRQREDKIQALCPIQLMVRMGRF
jgi:hypothetical protein